MSELLFFWAERFTEHALFLSILLDQNSAKELKTRATLAYEEWRQFLSEYWNFDQFDRLMSELYEIKEEVLNKLKQGKMLTSALPQADFKSLVQHMLEELSFVGKVRNNTMTEEEEIEFWFRESAEHTELAGKSILNNVYKKVEVLNLAEDLKIDHSLALFEKAEEDGIELLEKVETGEIESLVEPMMLLHEVKEAEYGAKRLQLLSA